MSDLTSQVPAPLKTLQTRPLFAMRLSVAHPLMFGATPQLERRIGVVEGGTFEGERLKGVVLSGGADWQQVRTDGAITLDVRLPLKTDDGALISMQYVGIRCGPPEIMAKIGQGEEVDPASYYFRLQARFETSAPKYEWLNRIFTVGSGHRQKTGPIYNLFEIR